MIYCVEPKRVVIVTIIEGHQLLPDDLDE